MLMSLNVSNFAILDRVEVAFRPGMTVLTGETGAGKSLIIDAISLLLGERASAEMIRSGAEKAEVTGIFRLENDRLAGLLVRDGIEVPDGILEVRREINLQNRNLIRVNGTAISLQQLKEIARHLADIHSQFDAQRLINPANYLDLVDGFRRDALSPYLSAYRESREIYREKLSAWKKLSAERKELLEKTELFRFQLKELRGADLRTGEEEELTAKAEVLANFDKVYARLQTLRSLFSEEGILDRLYEASSELSRLGELSSEFVPVAETAKNAYYELEDLADGIQKRLRTMNFDPEELDRISGRLSDLDRLKKKYGKTVSELLALRDELETRLDRTDHFDEYLSAAEQSLREAFCLCGDRAREISQVRRQIADRIEKELKGVFRDLVLPRAEFQIVLSRRLPEEMTEEGAFGDEGVDSAEFLLSTNVGEPLKPLAKTASGGEMSRIMLGFKTIFLKSQNLSTIVFDEIDTGISGAVAKQIARKIKEISLSCQVLSISHIPQVVAMADTHLKVEKKEAGGRTTASVRTLAYEDRVTEIAEMISGERITENTRQNARELLLGD